MRVFFSSRLFKPQTWLLRVIFIAWLVMDFKHTFQTVAVMSHASVGAQGATLILFGQWLPGITNATFDAFLLAFNITALIYLMVNTLAQRIVKRQSTWMYTTAMITATVISAFANAGVFFMASTGSFIIPDQYLGAVAAFLGTVITAGLLMFSSMDAMDLVSKHHKADAKLRERLDNLPKTKGNLRVVKGGSPHPYQLMSVEERRAKFGRKNGTQ